VCFRFVLFGGFVRYLLFCFCLCNKGFKCFLIRVFMVGSRKLGALPSCLGGV
jgi:hypothetical protein